MSHEDIQFKEDEITEAESLLKSIGVGSLKSAPTGATLVKRRSTHLLQGASIRKSAPLPNRENRTSAHVPSPANSPPTGYHPPPLRSSAPLSNSPSSSQISATSPNAHRPLPVPSNSRRGINSLPSEYSKTDRMLHLRVERM